MIFGYLYSPRRRLDQLDEHIIIATLIQHLTFELNKSMFSGPDQHSNHLVRNYLIKSEEFAKLDHCDSVAYCISMFFYHRAQHSDLILDIFVGFQASSFCFGTRNGPTITGREDQC